MTVVLTQGTAQVVLNYGSPTAFDSGAGATVLGFGGVDPEFDSWQDFAEIVEQAWADFIAPETSVVMGLSSVYWQNSTESGEVSSSAGGERAGELAVPNTAFLTSYTTNRKGPRGRGRSYWPGLLLDGDIQAGGSIEGSRLGALTTAFNLFWDEITVNDALAQPQVILQHQTTEQVTPPLNPVPVVQSRLYRGRAATQRRRLRS